MISDHQKKPANSPKRHEEALKREKSSVMEDIEFGEVKEDEFDAATAKTTAQQRPRRAKKKRKALSVLLTCGIYSFCSVITVLTNKSLASGYVVCNDDSRFFSLHNMVCLISISTLFE
mmetsp:Transcript_29132/g.42980  ORF Transcript_29132/g.42980 Transcript_29132/m.42980 type:complete len:118 (+) Transcript_29132:197-550(+)